MQCIVGLDLHLRRSVGTVMDVNGRVVKQERFTTSREGLAAFLKGVQHARIALEASGYCHPWVDYLESLGHEVTVAHPRKVRLIAESSIKTDKVDSEALAQLLRLGYLPASYVPGKPLRELRELARHRTKLGQERSRIKVRIRAEMNRRGLAIDSPFSMAGRKELANLRIPAVDNFLEQLSLVGRQVKECEERLAAAEAKHPHIGLLQTIAGVGLYTASVAVAGLGEVSRFRDAEKAVSYAGLAPSIYQSDLTERRGGITKRGPADLRRALCEAAWVHVGCCPDSDISRLYRRVYRRTRCKQKAITAAAAKLVRIMYAMMRDNQPYHAREEAG